MKLTATIAFVLFSFVSFSQQSIDLKTKRDTVLILQQMIREGNWVSSACHGIACFPVHQWYTFAYYTFLATETELIESSRDESVCLRLYSYAGLLHFKSRSVDTIEKQLLNDPTLLTIGSGCVTSPETLVSYAIQEISTWCDEEFLGRVIKKLSQDENTRTKLFEALIYTEGFSEKVTQLDF